MVRGAVQELNLPCFFPANGSTCYIRTPHPVPVALPPALASRGRRMDPTVAPGGANVPWNKRLLAPNATTPLVG